MVVVFNTSLDKEVADWGRILKKLHEEYYAEKIEVEFKDWVYEKYEVQVFHQQLTMPGGIARIDVPDNAVTYLKLRFS